MDASIQHYGPFLVLLIAWELFWKASAMWIAARRGEKAWYVLLLTVNSLGILPMAYIFFFSKDKQDLNSTHLDVKP